MKYLKLGLGVLGLAGLIGLGLLFASPWAMLLTAAVAGWVWLCVRLARLAARDRAAR